MYHHLCTALILTNIKLINHSIHQADRVIFRDFFEDIRRKKFGDMTGLRFKTGLAITNAQWL